MLLLTLAPFALAGAVAWFVCASMPRATWAGPLPPLTEAERALSAELREIVVALCESGERNSAQTAALDRAVEVVTERLGSAGRPVRRESYDVGAARAHNLVLELPGSSPEIVLVGAHYDTAHGSPGANDNGSGVAVLCALARRFAGQPHVRTLRFVAFANEEPPWFHTEDMGSRVHAAGVRQRGERVVAMLALETLGCYSDEDGSQAYPIGLLELAYPSRGDFVAFVGDLGSRSLVRRCVDAFREHARFPSEGAALPASIAGVAWSDHSSFWPIGVPAVMVTDTAFLRDPHYHRATDTPDRLDYDRLARVTLGLEAVLERLANGN